jgi:sulfatase maturation enzyme AslB (radical SAM superfamily)
MTIAYTAFKKGNMRYIASENYNSAFNEDTGFFARWGKTEEDDPDVCIWGPEILDIEISTTTPLGHVEEDDSHIDNDSKGCKGNCGFCYKSNTFGHPTYNMTFDEFKKIIDSMPQTLTQIAFGIMNIDSNPDFYKMARYAREKHIVPNFTMHGLDDITPEQAKEIKELFGACAVSVYDKEKSYNTIKTLTDAGMTQVNIHYMISRETYDAAFDIMHDIQNDPRLEKLNALVFLSLKQKGRGVKYNTITTEEFGKLVHTAIDAKLPFGFDSCSAHKFLAAIKDDKHYDLLAMMSEPCEATCFSSYVNAKGEFYPCSFAEGHDEFGQNGQSVLTGKPFTRIWHSPETLRFRKSLLDKGRECPLYEI